MSAADRTPGDGNVVACLWTGEAGSDKPPHGVLVYEDHGDDDEPTLIIPCKSDSAARNLLRAIETFTTASVI